MNHKIWAYFIELSNHMWDDETVPPRGWYEKPRYCENNNVDIKVWDKIVAFLAERQYNALVIDVGDGVQYDSHPEISAPDAWSKELLKQKLEEARALGLEPIPKLNFSCAHHTWLKKYRRMVSTPEYYQACADVIREVAEIFGTPRLFHLGMDEEHQGSAVKFREALHARAPMLWWHDMLFLINEVEKNGSRAWVWADYYWNHSEEFIQNMPKSVVQSNWFYQRFKSDTPDERYRKRIATYEELDNLGYDQIPCCSNCRGFDGGAVNPFQTLTHAREVLTDNHVMGFLMAPWRATDELSQYYLMDAAHSLYDARRQAYPETLKNS